MDGENFYFTFTLSSKLGKNDWVGFIVVVVLLPLVLLVVFVFFSFFKLVLSSELPGLELQVQKYHKKHNTSFPPQQECRKKLQFLSTKFETITWIILHKPLYFLIFSWAGFQDLGNHCNAKPEYLDDIFCRVIGIIPKPSLIIYSNWQCYRTH